RSARVSLTPDDSFTSTLHAAAAHSIIPEDFLRSPPSPGKDWNMFRCVPWLAALSTLPLWAAPLPGQVLLGPAPLGYGNVAFGGGWSFASFGHHHSIFLSTGYGPGYGYSPVWGTSSF